MVMIIKTQMFVMISVLLTANEDTTLNQPVSGDISGLCKIAVAGLLPLVEYRT